MSALDRLGDAVETALDEHQVSEVLSVLLGCTVGLVVALAQNKGINPDEQITIDGGDSRDVTIHAKKGGAARGASSTA